MTAAVDTAELIRTAAETLQRTDLTAAAARAVENETGEAAQRLGQRIAAIAPRSQGRSPGPERSRVLAVGSDEAIAALAVEHDRLAEQLERLTALQGHATAVRQAAQAREASEALPGQYAAMDEALAGLERARAAVRNGEAAVHALRGHIGQSRALAHAANLPAPAAPVELVRRLIELLPAAARHPEAAAEQLGIDLAAARQAGTGAATGVRWAA